MMELTRSYQVGTVTRREFLVRATIMLGSTAAASSVLAACAASPENPRPVVEEPTAGGAATQPTAAAAETGAEITAGPSPAAGGLVTESVEYPDLGGAETLSGYLAAPAAAGGAPGVVVIQEWWGLDDHIKEVTGRLAGAGFVALAPDLYHGVVATEPDEARKQVMALDMAEAVREIQAAVDYLKTRPDVSGDKIGVVGFCMGGGLALQTVAADEDVGAAVAYYGEPLPAERASTVKAPVQAHYGTADRFEPAAIEAMDTGLDESGFANEVHMYEGAGHAFLNDQRESYHAAAAQEAWDRTVAFFRAHLS
jgi:carboxymethylenebutenolidase